MILNHSGKMSNRLSASGLSIGLPGRPRGCIPTVMSETRLQRNVVDPDGYVVMSEWAGSGPCKKVPFCLFWNAIAMGNLEYDNLKINTLRQRTVNGDD